MKFSIHDLFGSSAYVRGAEVVLGLRRVSDGYAKLHFLKDRDGDLPISTAWGLLFDQEEGFRRDPNDGVIRDLREELLELLADGEWWTLTVLRKTKDEGGVGADRDKIKAELEGMTVDGSLEFELGPEGQRRDAKCWRLKRREAVDDGDDAYPKPGAEGEAEGLPPTPHGTTAKRRGGVTTLDPRGTTRPSAAERLANPDAVLSRSDLRELGYERRAVDAVFRACPIVALPGYSRPVIAVRDYLALLERSTFDGRSRVR
jgi:hypothetical protein